MTIRLADYTSCMLLIMSIIVIIINNLSTNLPLSTIDIPASYKCESAKVKSKITIIFCFFVVKSGKKWHKITKY